jgi:putative endonuclease
MQQLATQRNRINLGNLGQNLVETFLRQRGYTLLAKNFHTRVGELDLVMAKDETVCFIEVKTRNNKYLPLSTTITWSKQQRIAKTAKIFAHQHQIHDKVLRFDVATVLMQNPNNPEIEYLPNAFFATHYN